jgi:hypothetical protein
MDASEMVLAMLNYKANIGQTAILLGTETWQMLGSGPVQLAVQVDPTSQVWDAASSTHVQFEGVSNLGTIVS